MRGFGHRMGTSTGCWTMGYVELGKERVEGDAMVLISTGEQTWTCVCEARIDQKRQHQVDWTVEAVLVWMETLDGQRMDGEEGLRACWYR